MTDHEGSVVAVKDHKGVWTIGYVAACSCGWQSVEMRDRHSATLPDLHDHNTTVRQEATP